MLFQKNTNFPTTILFKKLYNIDYTDFFGHWYLNIFAGVDNSGGIYKFQRYDFLSKQYLLLTHLRWKK
ncbi:TPA: hypothetical protein DIC40_02695 [Patescibacteria group bacterium]|nr:hypothetical protein [Candidatus Gracilibacteria bacterium]